ncbi:uncharacterized protein LOC9657483 [Selaginella moellendorffii]|uniref:uncharacterized protein LOC9657483 n=1 Tax=Selaginella moellendorffii TaxID=88036 RepID=UPI000D1CD5AD|nr:uncharacterized protein LOC9657483 [Selaginella moellendorffii]|eukprot:XP_024517734.1 uncharacterized protein LOC9657483 [Selaginella moellendorffii]
MPGVSRFSENGLALPARPSSSQKKKRRARHQQQQQQASYVRKSVTMSRKKKRQGSVEDAMRAYRAQLRPLLDAIRFVESSNRVDCPDGDGGASIGPLQISEHYHVDAWKNKRASWLRCRDLEHAENTVVAYWMRYCSEALTQHDWEILAKIHNGGPQGPQREKTTYYWSKVCRYLEENHRHVSPFPSPARPECKIYPSTSKFTNLDKRIECKLKHGLKVLAAERRLPIVNKHPRLQVRRLPFTDISSTALNVCSSRHEPGRLIDDLSIQRLGLEYSFLSSESAVELDSENQPLKQSSSDDEKGFATPSVKKKEGGVDRLQDLHEEAVECRSSSARNLDILYSSELSEQKEEEILTELARLLPLDLSECVDRRNDESFEFPPVPEQADYATPVMNPDSRAMQVAAENVPGTGAETAISTPKRKTSASLDFDATFTLLEQLERPESSLSSGAEKKLMSELADLLDLPQAATPPRQTEQEEDELAKHTAKLSLADFLLEIPDPSASIEYVKALFSCENILLEKLCHKVGGLEESLDSSEPMPVPPPAASIRTEESRTGNSSFGAGCTCHSSDNRLTSSLKRLCAVWEEQDVDLLTRSLRFKMLTASSSSSELSTKEAPCIAWEIHALQNIDKSAKSRRAAKELIQQQRDKIYINIGAYASRSERHQLYSAWGVRRLSTGRLKKIVYDLMWRDTKRYSHSAELVSLYL